MASSNTVTIDVVADTTSAIKSISTLSSSITKTLAGVTATVAAAVVGIGKESLEAYSDYEQLVDGIAIMFGDSADQLLENASNAFSTAQVSANSYLESVSNFGMLLVNSLDGDTETAVGYVEMALSDMADISNAFGLELEEVSDVYKSLSRGIYRTLDNLQLGYAGTKTGLQALIEDANEYAETIGETGDLTEDSYADIIQAIDYIIEKQGLAGIAAYEATETLQGSLNTLQAVWENWLLGLADEDADLSELTENLVMGLENVAKNVLPRIEQIGEGLAAALPEAVANAAATVAPMLAESIAAIWNTASALLSEYTSIDIGTIDASDVEDAVSSIGEVFQELWDIVEPVIGWFVEYAIPSFVSALEDFTSTDAVETVESLADSLGELDANGIETISDAFGNMSPDEINEACQTLYDILGDDTENAQTFADTLNSFDVDSGGSIFESFSLLSDIIPDVAALAGVVTVVKGLGTVLSGFAGSAGIGTLVSGFTSLINPAKNVKTVFSIITTLLGSFAPAVLLGVTALGGLSLAFLDSYENSDTFREMVDGLPEIIGSALSTAASTIVEYLPQMLEALVEVLGMISEYLSENGPEIISAAFEFLAEIGAIFYEYLPQIMNALGEIIGQLIAYVIANAPEFLSAASNLMLAFINGIVQMAGGILAGFIEGVGEFAADAWEWFQEQLNNLIDWIKGLLGIASPSTVFAEMGNDIIQGLLDGLNELIEDVIGFFGDLVEDITGAIEDPGELLVSTGKSIMDGLWSGLKSTWKSVKEWVGGIASWIEENKGPIEYDAKLLIPAGEAIMEGLYSGLKAGFSDVETLMEDVTDSFGTFTADATVDMTLSGVNLQGIDSSSALTAAGTTINQTFETKVVRSDSDLYTAAPIIYRNALREASLI